MDEFLIKLSYPPTANTYWRHARGRHFIDKPGLDYRAEVSWRVATSRRFSKPMKGLLVVDVQASVPDRRVRDVDNLFKALLDSLQHARLFENDSQIWDLRLRWRWLDDGGSVTVIVREETPPSEWEIKPPPSRRRAKKDPPDRLRLDGSLRLRR